MSDPAEGVARVYYDVFDFDDDLASLDGVPFTGIVYSQFQDGRIESETHYVDGLPHGLSEDWYPDGQLAARNIAVRGQGSSESWTWHRNGTLASYRRDADLRPVEIKYWDEHGILLDT